MTEGVWAIRDISAIYLEVRRGGAKLRPKARGILRAELSSAPSAPESMRGQRGESPLQANLLRPEIDCNCVAARRGGEQQEVKDQSVG